MKYIYQLNKCSLENWRSYAVSNQKIESTEDISILTRALMILQKAFPDLDCLKHNEYWITPCPASYESLVIIRLNMNPYSEAYLISPIELVHLKEFNIWESKP